MKPLRIALVHNLPAGGAKRHTYEQVRELVTRGHVIDELTLSTADRQFENLRAFVRQQEIYELHWRPLLKMAIRGVGPYVHLAQNYFNLVRVGAVSKKMATRINQGDYDVIFLKDCRFTVAPRTLRYLEKPSLLYLHSLPRRRSESSGGNGSLLESLRRGPIAIHERMIEREFVRNLKSAHLVITNSRYTSQTLLSDFAVRAEIVYPGVDVDVFRPAGGSTAQYVLSVGSLLPQKGHLFAVDAVGLIQSDRRPPLVVATPWLGGPARAQIEAYAQQRGVDLRLVSCRTAPEMAKVYGQALCLLFAARLEWLGLAVLEAMACGIPVLALREGGPLDTVQDGVTGFLLDPDPERFAEALLRLESAPELRQRLGAAARQAVLDYWTWPRAVDDLEGQFETLLAPRRAR